MTDPLRWQDDPSLGPELKEWLTKLSPPTALPPAKLASLEEALEKAGNIPTDSPSAEPTVPPSSAGELAASQGTGVVAFKLAWIGGAIGVMGAGALALATALPVGSNGGEVSHSVPNSPPLPSEAAASTHVTSKADAELEAGAIAEADAVTATESIAFGSGMQAQEEPSAPAAKGRKAPASPLAQAFTASDKAASGLAAEAALLARAQASLTTNPERTLELLAEYEARFSARRMELEADVLRVEALAAAGQGAAAQQAARAHREAYPRSPYLGRVESWTGSNSLKDEAASANQ